MKPLTLEEIRQRAEDGCGTTPLEREFLLAEVDKLKDWLLWATEFTVLDNRIQEVYPGCWVVCRDVPYPKGRVYLTSDGRWVDHQPMDGEEDIVFPTRYAAEGALDKKLSEELAEPHDPGTPHGPRSGR